MKRIIVSLILILAVLLGSSTIWTLPSFTQVTPGIGGDYRVCALQKNGVDVDRLQQSSTVIINAGDTIAFFCDSPAR